MTASVAPLTRRVDRGRNHEYVLDGVKCEGVTTLIKGGVPAPALIGWAARTVAEAAAERRDVLMQLAPDEIVDLLKGVPFRDRDRAGNRGTEVHRLAMHLARGEQVEVPDEILGHVDAYLAWRDAWEPEDEIVEASVINRKWRYMGTLDWLGRMPKYRDGYGIIDVKTSRSGPFGEVALQLAAYGHAETLLLPAPDSKPRNKRWVEEPMRPIDWYAVLWLTGDSWELYPYDVGEREFRTFLYAAGTARWMKDRASSDAPSPVKGHMLARPDDRPQLSVVSGTTATASE